MLALKRAQAVCLAVAVLFLVAAPARAGVLADARSALAGAVAAVEDVRTDENFLKDMDPYLARARAVLVVPNLYKGALFIGGTYGNGVLTVRNDQGQFSPPAFYRVAGGSLGLQFGAQSAQMIFMIMTEKGLNAVLKDQFKVGATTGVTFATFGANIEASTTSAIGKDIIAFAHADGAFGGAAVEGSVIQPRHDWNEAFYGRGARPNKILFERAYPMTTDAEALAAALNAALPGGGQAAPAPAPVTSDAPAAVMSSPAGSQDPGMILQPVTLQPVEKQALE